MNERLKAFLASQSVSFWLKDAIRSSLDRDPVDAVNDVEDLLAILSERLQVILEEDALLSSQSRYD